jgi:hypothetical protein
LKYSNSTKTIYLFNNSNLSSTLVTYKLEHPKNDAERLQSAEVAMLSNTSTSLTLASVFPALGSTPFDTISFSSSKFLHQTFFYDESKALAWHFSANWKIDESRKTLYQVLRNVLGVNATTLSIYAALGTKAGRDRLLDVQNLAIQGVFGGLNYSPAGLDWVHLTSTGARLFGSDCARHHPRLSSMASLCLVV